MWLLMIALHTLTATVAFGAGIAALSPARARRVGWLAPVFLGSLVGMTIFVIGAMASHWSDLGGLNRIVFAGLVGLALFMVIRGVRAYTALRSRRLESETYINDIGFVLISLFNGFVIVGAIDLGAPGWLVGVAAVAAVVAGTRLLHLVRVREMNAPA